MRIKRVERIAILSFLLICIVVFTMGCGSSYEEIILDEKNSDVIHDDEQLQEEIEEENYKRILIAAVGDIMGHMPQVYASKDWETGEYDFKDNYKEVKPIFEQADLTIGNLETTLAGSDRGYTGFPMFNTPSVLARDLAWAGFDILSTANNHSLDRGASGLERTLNKLDKYELIGVGTHRSQKEREQITVVDVQGIDIALLAYTYGTNGIPIPTGREYLVNLIDEEVIKRDIEKAKERSDVVVVCMHWGDEYQRLPNANQKYLAEKLVKWGADVILGSHPHVIQPYEYIRIENQEEVREGVVIYSMGNFISNQRREYRDTGIIFQVELIKDLNNGNVSIGKVDWVTTWVRKFYENNKWNYRILPVEEYVLKIKEGKELPFTEEERNKIIKAWKDTNKHLLN
ncbi:poly-gamma-glutamate synthesis protein (capsule biosynthesis protein) [Desulfitispora alkaliphila]|uniref:CapA family protein n=1 Tax=Desulfitispora alkaliphila TaxID=622674 RepID=UPI003D23C87E